MEQQKKWYDSEKVAGAIAAPILGLAVWGAFSGEFVWLGAALVGIGCLSALKIVAAARKDAAAKRAQAKEKWDAAEKTAYQAAEEIVRQAQEERPAHLVNEIGGAYMRHTPTEGCRSASAAAKILEGLQAGKVKRAERERQIMARVGFLKAREVHAMGLVRALALDFVPSRVPGTDDDMKLVEALLDRLQGTGVNPAWEPPYQGAEIDAYVDPHMMRPRPWVGVKHPDWVNKESGEIGSKGPGGGD